ncbi:MAG TPA: DUF6339 family protein [Thermoanaerobaculia bacterium]|nr:DUF6339 family protein [Thermoanaerobaculia bacterium]
MTTQLNDEFLSGGPKPPLSRLEVDDTDPDAPIDSTLLTALVDHATKNYEDDPDALDSWLAPRLHCAVRWSRRAASDPLRWSWLAVNYGHPYIQARWRAPRTGRVHTWRYTGELLRNGLSRLWWGAEMVRNGPDYGDVARLFRHVRTAQFALELRYSWYRPAAIAFTRVAEPEGKKPLSDDQKRVLSTRANAYLSTLMLEAMATVEGQTTKADEVWYESPPVLRQVIDTPEGPDDGRVPDEATDRLVTWFGGLVPTTDESRR